MSQLNNDKPSFIVSVGKSKRNLAIILGSILVVVVLIGGVWFFVQNKDTKNSNVAEQSNNAQQDNQYNNSNQSKSNPDSVSLNEGVEGNLKIYNHYSRGIQFAYNRAWQAKKEEGSASLEALLFENLPTGDYLSFRLLPPVDVSGKVEILRKGENDNGFKYEIFRVLDFSGSEEKPKQQVIELWIKHTINDQFTKQGVLAGTLYGYYYSFPVSKGEAYIPQVVSELETIAKSFKQLYSDPYTVRLSSGKKLSFRYPVNFELVSDTDGTISFKAKDYNLDVKLYYNKPFTVDTKCLSIFQKASFKFDNITGEYRGYTKNETNESQCASVSGIELIEANLGGEKVFLEFVSPVAVDDRILLLVKSMEIQS